MDAATVSSHGVTIRLTAANTALLDALVSRLPLPWRTSDSKELSQTFSLDVGPSGRKTQGHRYTLRRGGRELVSTPSLDEALLFFESGARFHVAAMSPVHTFVHAGVVALHGRAIVLPAVSGGGKTTLTAALVRAGASYLSDEYAPIDERGYVHPFPKPLSIVQPRGRPMAQPVEMIGGVQETRALPVALVALTSFAGPERCWNPSVLTPGEALLELLQHTVSAQRRPANALRRLERMVVTAAVLHGDRGDADQTAAKILKRI